MSAPKPPRRDREKCPPRFCAYAHLTKDIEALTEPNYHNLNEHAGRNDRLLHAVLCAYAKHALESPDIGWDELAKILYHAIANEIGDDAYIEWVERIKGP